MKKRPGFAHFFLKKTGPKENTIAQLLLIFCHFEVVIRVNGPVKRFTRIICEVVDVHRLGVHLVVAAVRQRASQHRAGRRTQLA